ncbi:VWA domain-containing protein [Zooshikella marina]|uniref:VWA domain-containing protein n=1 Tax=Zooshikella ganghwensis TaxID=202772 RepID=UPI001BB0548B|nr:VWA domain-containing protein [Zooshikella ganghwensis]MBU2704453.1 VWA domain-containing protein [Zooshikella ganghwensis]
MKKKILLLFVCFFSLGLHAHESYGVLIMDTSGSMRTPRHDGSSRCEYSILQAKSKVFRFFYQLHGKKIDIRTFNSGGNIISITGGFVDKFDAAMNALNSLSGKQCQGATALAEAMCLAADDLRFNYSNEAKQGDRLMVFGSTDGDENNSPRDICGGSDWQAKVEATYLDLPQVEFNATIFIGNVGLLSDSENKYGDYGYLYNMPPNGFTALSTPTTFEFLKKLAKKTGGQVETVKDSDVGDGSNDPW